MRSCKDSQEMPSVLIVLSLDELSFTLVSGNPDSTVFVGWSIGEYSSYHGIEVG